MTANCYRCGAPATSREHFPPKSFFPGKAGLQLRTVGSCDLHNNAKSNDDQYVLALICIRAMRGDNLAKRIFLRSILPQMDRAPGFRSTIIDRSAPDGTVVGVDIDRLDAFFDALCCAVFFDRFGEPLDPDVYRMRHVYLDVACSDDAYVARQRSARALFRRFFDFYHSVECRPADKVDEAIYDCHIIAPAGVNASVSIAHTFYGVFEVVSYLTNTNVLMDFRALRRARGEAHSD